ncbi:MAG: ABC transporter ATP-binding protein [Ruminococcaceae bacterium]|jgi:zinc transport system ATP-binding protein|nr:ABC transporter ATP-binding protein [Oscillospiraceae bacterium]
MAQVKCENVSLAYDGMKIVSDLNFEVNKGDYLCIVGENGSGKSTLIKTLLGLKTPNDGSINFGDGLTQDEIGYLPQQTSAQKDFPASVYEVVLSGCLNKIGKKPFFSKADKKRAEMNIERLGISDLKKRCYRELSGGQQQRVLLARALCATEKLLLLDEPTAGLDPKVTMDFYALISSLNKSGITIIMVSHDINAAVEYSSHILHMSHKPLFFGKTSDYVQSPIGRAFIGGDE